jgi:HK97 family phage portal protein
MILSRIFKRADQIPAVPLNTATISRVLGTGGESSAGVSVTPDTALGYPAVWRGVNIRAGTVGRLPLNVMKRIGVGKEVDEKHPSQRLLREQPNSEQTAKAFKTLLESHAILAGGGFALIARDEFGQPEELIPMAPENVMPFRENGRLGYSIVTGGAMAVEPPENILHIKGLSWDGINGLGITDVLRESIGLGLAAQKWQSVFFKNGAAPQTVIELPGSLRNKEAVERFRAMWGKRHRGIDNAHQPALLENGAQLKAFSVSPNDAEMLSTREFEIKQVASMIGISSHYLGDPTRTSFASLEVENRNFLRDLQDPLTNWESECYQKLLSPAEKERRSHVVEFDKEQVERPDLTTFTNALVTQVNNGLLSLDEARDKMNMPPLPNGEGAAFRIPLNMGTIGEEPEGEAEPDDEPMADDIAAAAAAVLSSELKRAGERIAADAKTRSKHGDLAKYNEWRAQIEDRHHRVVSRNIEPATDMIAVIKKCSPAEIHTNILGTFFATIAERYAAAADSSSADLPIRVAEASADVARIVHNLASKENGKTIT